MENIDTDYQLLKEQTICAEINLYRSIVSIDYDLDPLGWWKTNHHLYPSISKIAKKVLSIPSTSAASERVFSSGGRTITKLRSSLHSDNAADLIFLKGSWGVVEAFIDSQEEQIAKRKSFRNIWIELELIITHI